MTREERAISALEMLYDKYENGTPCFQAYEGVIAEGSSSIGTAIKLSFAEEQEILNLIVSKAESYERACSNCKKPYRAHLLHDGKKCSPGSAATWFPGKDAAIAKAEGRKP